MSQRELIADVGGIEISAGSYRRKPRTSLAHTPSKWRMESALMASERSCVLCGAPLTGRSDRRTCSVKCRMRVARARISATRRNRPVASRNASGPLRTRASWHRLDSLCGCEDPGGCPECESLDRDRGGWIPW
jgi:hypothetical protein